MAQPETSSGCAADDLFDNHGQNNGQCHHARDYQGSDADIPFLPFSFAFCHVFVSPFPVPPLLLRLPLVFLFSPGLKEAV